MSERILKNWQRYTKFRKELYVERLDLGEKAFGNLQALPIKAMKESEEFIGSTGESNKSKTCLAVIGSNINMLNYHR
jgi:hypothetical protein